MLYQCASGSKVIYGVCEFACSTDSIPRLLSTCCNGVLLVENKKPAAYVQRSHL